MRAILMERVGPPQESLAYKTDFAKPVRMPDEVLLKAACSSVNAIDWKVRKGMVPSAALKLPKILGGDVSGVVVEAPAGSKFKPGDRVFGCTGQQGEFSNPYGTYAELVSAKESALAAMPAGVGFAKAAAVPLAAMTAWQAMAPSMPLQGKRVLVHAGSGGVGGFGVQIAKAQGAHVTTTCSGRNADFVRSLGADEVVDYTQAPFEQQLASADKFDVVLEVMGGDYEARSMRLLKRNGHLAEVLNPGYILKYGTAMGLVRQAANIARWSLAGATGLGPRYTMTLLKCQADKGLDQIAGLMAEGKLKVHIDKTWPLEQVAAAHEYSETGRTRGKVVITVDGGLAAAAPAS